MNKRIRKSLRLRAALGGVLGAGLVVGATGATEAQAVTFIPSDLEFILQQIKIAENHAAGNPLAGNGPLQVSNPMLPYGLRAVDGSGNNIQPDQGEFGASDNTFPRLTTPFFRNGENFNIFGPGGFGDQAGGSATSYEQTKGFVEDSQPRVISNLISDISQNNPAAVAAAEQNPNASSIDDGFPANPDPFVLPNRATDEGLSAPYNSWFTFFGQFFDHGLDLVNKGGSGTVLVPLKPDDPLIAGPDGILGNADDVPPSRRFIPLTRATNQPGPDGVLGDDPGTAADESADDVHEHANQTTPFVDQNQTYTSHPSHQVFHRQYAVPDAGAPASSTNRPVSTGYLLDGANGGLSNWAEVKQQASEKLGIRLTDHDVLNVPLLETDPYGEFVRGDNGFPLVVLEGGGTREGDPTANGGLGVDISDAVKTGHAFLDDIAHAAAPKDSNTGANKTADANDIVNPPGPPLPAGEFDNELLEAHFITGDGRGNENIGLTTVHHVFHSEHNRLADHVKDVVLGTAAGGDFTFLNQWLATPYTGPAVPTDPAALDWDGERIFQAAKFGTEMQYQHLVFEEFGRKFQPNINVFAGYQTEINPAIVAEFAHTVYRFGHSMLNEDIPRTNPDGSANDIGLIAAFLNPVEFNATGVAAGAASDALADAAAGAIVQGTTRQVGNELDEFVTDALRDNLLGLPLDLPAINLARGRDTGIPSLNNARKELYVASGNNSALQPYASWEDFGLGLRHPESLVNFIAAYGKHPDIVGATTNADKRRIAYAIVYGAAGADGVEGNADDADIADIPEDRVEFMQSLNGTTPGVAQWANDAEGNSITGLDDVDLWIGGLAERQAPFGGLLGSTFNYVFETQLEKLQDGDRFYYLHRLAGLNFLSELENNSFAALIQRNSTGTKHLPADVFSRPDYVIEAANAATWPAGQVSQIGSQVRFVGGEHIVLAGSDTAHDNLRADDGDDTIYGYKGNDRLEGGAGNDVTMGGDGNDIITDSFGDDNIKGGPGHDAISGGPGIDLLLAGFGDDTVVGGEDVSETFGGGGDDIIIAGEDSNTVFANEGDDWVQGGDGADLLQGGNGDPFQVDTKTGHDVIIGDGGNDDYDSEGGDDIMVTGPGIERNEGMLGFDWVTHRLDPQAARADMNFTGLMPPDLDNIRDRFDLVEGLSGWTKDDILRGDSGTEGANPDEHTLTAEGIARIDGLQEVVGEGVTSFNAGNIILGGLGSDLIEGRGGNDIIDGDKQLNVQLRAPDTSTPAPDDTKLVSNAHELTADIFAGKFTAADVDIVRTIESPTPGANDVDTAVFSDVLANYQIVPDGDDPTIHTVSHLDGAGIDGTDTVRNVERLQFADQTVVLSGTNPPPAGSFSITGVAIEDGSLTVDPAQFGPAGPGVTVTDVNGINLGTLAFEWQAETDPGVWTTVGIGQSFTPGDGEVGLQIRAVATFQDGLGVFENISSAPTAPVVNVNDAPTGAPSISDTTPQIGQSLTATRGSIDDADGMTGVVLAYQWQADTGAGFVDFGPAGPVSGPAPADADLRVRVSFTDANGTNETVFSAVTARTPVPPGVTPRIAVSGLRIAQSLRSNATTVTVKVNTAATLRIQIRNTKGKVVRQFVVKKASAGNAKIRWNKRNTSGIRVKPGRYRFIVFAKSATGEKKVVAKWVRIR